VSAYSLLVGSSDGNARIADPVPRKISDFLSNRQFRSLGLHSEFFRVFDRSITRSVLGAWPPKGCAPPPPPAFGCLPFSGATSGFFSQVYHTHNAKVLDPRVWRF
jgi:hypothetical protein